MDVLITGAAGFIGSSVADYLLARGDRVLGIDSLNDYYDPTLKQHRLDRLESYDEFSFEKVDICDKDALNDVWCRFSPAVVVHLAAQAGVRYSLENPDVYIQTNVVGFQNVIELCRETKPKNFVYASSSSVYGGIREYPQHEQMVVNQPVSLYAVTKISNELVATTYGNLYGIPNTGLRFFTVYGPRGRPDMALFNFSKLMTEGKEIPVFNEGKLKRDFTYIDDIVAGVVEFIDKPQMNEVFNLGKGDPDELMDMIRVLADAWDIKPKLKMLPMQRGDVYGTHADISRAKEAIGYSPATSLKEGVAKFVEWYKQYYGQETSQR